MSFRWRRQYEEFSRREPKPNTALAPELVCAQCRLDGCAHMASWVGQFLLCFCMWCPILVIRAGNEPDDA